MRVRTSLDLGMEHVRDSYIFSIQRLSSNLQNRVDLLEGNPDERFLLEKKRIMRLRAAQLTPIKRDSKISK